MKFSNTSEVLKKGMASGKSSKMNVS